MISPKNPATRGVIGGKRYEQCVVCRDWFPLDQLIDIEAASVADETEVIMRACEHCWTGLQTGEIDLELILLEDEERVEQAW